MAKPKQTLEDARAQLLENLKITQDRKQRFIIREVEIKAQLEIVEGLIQKLYPPKEEPKEEDKKDIAKSEQ